jgi:hypothetical protein
MSDAPRLIDLLGQEDPATLAALRGRYPSQSTLLTAERALGPEATAPFALGIEKRTAVKDLILASGTSLITELDRLSVQIRDVMRRVGMIRFVGSLIATVSGGLAAILIVVLSNEAVQAIAAFLAMLGGIAAITADQFERAPSGIRIASAEEYAKVIEMRSNLEVVRVKLERDNVFPVSDDDMNSMLKEVDGYAGSIVRLKMA